MAKAVTLFSGVGASSKVLRDLGYDVIAHDIMPEAALTLRANGFIARHIDVRAIDYSLNIYSDVEVLVGGPPCQPFSQAHDGDGEYDPRDMIPEFIRAVRELRPATFLMEEVKTLTWKKHRAYLDRVVADLETEGYTVEWKVVDSSDYGSGQARKRLFIVGRRHIAYSGRTERRVPITWPSPCPDWARMTMAEALDWTKAECFYRNQQAPEPARVPEPDWHDENAPHLWPLKRPSTTVVGSFRPEVQAAPGYRKAGDGPRQNTPGSVVTTLEERLVLQGLPRDWIVKGSKSSQDLQVGNSCPTQMLQAVLEANLWDAR